MLLSTKILENLQWWLYCVGLHVYCSLIAMYGIHVLCDGLLDVSNHKDKVVNKFAVENKLHMVLSSKRLEKRHYIVWDYKCSF